VAVRASIRNKRGKNAEETKKREKRVKGGEVVVVRKSKDADEMDA
jgi:hypothetical protein